MNKIATTEIVAYNEFRAQLNELKEYNDSVTFEYGTKKGTQEAKSHIYKLRKTKSAVESCRKKEKAASLEYGRKVDGEAKEIISEIEDMIEVHQKPIDEIAQKEQERVDHILLLIEEVRYNAIDVEGRSADDLRSRLNDLNTLEITEDIYQEFTEQAAGAKALAIETLNKLVNERQQYEDEQAELERLRKESEERARKDREEKIAKEAADRARREAEAKAERQRQESERKEKDLQRQIAIAEQKEKEQKEKALRAAKDAEDRLRREAEETKRLEAEALATREADKKHKARINNAASDALRDLAGVNLNQSKNIIRLIASKKIPGITIQY